MAYVTRCPYCGSVWLMPDKETADRTPVKCLDCNHSFDATCSLTAVPDSLFPGRVPVMLQGSGMPVAATDKKEPFSERAPALPLRQNGFPTAPRLATLSSLPWAVAATATPKLKIEAEGAQATDSAAHGAPTKAGRKKRSGAGSLILTVIVLIAIACVVAVIFNQRLMAAFPQTEPYFDNVCRTIPCPGFYLHQIESFVVSKTNLRPLDESGNYALEVTVVNGSSTAQAVPDLQIELVDDNDGSLLRKTLTPPEFLDPGQADESIAARGQLTVRVNLQTNVTPARCIVTPVYSKQQK